MIVVGLIVSGFGAVVAVVGLTLLLIAARAAMRVALNIGDTRPSAWRAYVGNVWGWGIVFTASALAWMLVGVALVILGRWVS